MTGILPQILANALVAAAVYCMAAAGFTLIYGVTRFFNLAHGAAGFAGAYATLFLLGTLGAPAWTAILGGIATTVLLGLVIDTVAYRPLRRRGASTMVLLVASLGVMTVIEAVLALVFTNRFHALVDGTPRTFSAFGAVVTSYQLVGIVTAALTTIGLVLLLRRTRLGRTLRAVADDETVATIVGIRTDRVIAVAVAIGMALVACAALLVGFDTGVQPHGGMQLLLKGVIAAIIGGMGSVPGAALGAVLLGVTENLGAAVVGSEWKDAIAFGLLIAFLLVKPRGIISR